LPQITGNRGCLSLTEIIMFPDRRDHFVLLVRILRRCRDGDRLRSGGHQLRRSSLVRPANIRERGQQVRVGPYVISRHLSIGKNGKKDINSIVG
jgi:hypothetical protein